MIHWLSFLPWLTFPIIDEFTTLKTAAMVSLAISVIINIQEIFAQKPKFFTTETILFFLLVTLIPVVASEAIGQWIENSALLLTTLYLGSISLISLFSGNYFTLEFSRKKADDGQEPSSHYLRKNRRLTQIWCVTFFLIALWEFFERAFALTHSFSALLIPYGMIFIAAIITITLCLSFKKSS